MDHIEEAVRRISRIWRMHKRRESLYKLAMNMEVTAQVRKICSVGYMSTLLFKKEIASLYEDIKCSLTDGDLNSITRSEDYDGMAESTDWTNIVRLIRTHQENIVAEYRTFLHAVDLEILTAAMMNDHIGKLNELTKKFDVEVPPVLQPATVSIVAVA